MASHGHSHQDVTEKVELNKGAGTTLALMFLVAGIVGLAVALFTSTEPGFGRFYHAYLVSYIFVLTLGFGGLFFTLIQHLVAAAWSVVVRRIAEAMASLLPILALGAIPILITVIRHDALLYPWAVDLPAEHATETKVAANAPSQPLPVQLVDASNASTRDAVAAHVAAEHKEGSSSSAAGAEKEEPLGQWSSYLYHDTSEFTVKKEKWLNSTFFTIRIIFYFAVWSGMALYFYGQSRKQDTTGDYTISQRLRKLSAPLTVVFALVTTFAMFDLVMSLDHHWFSTMFGVYMFAGAMIGTHATIVVVMQILQRKGYLLQSVNKEHYHDLGKFLFMFVFFWGYVGFAQYMLQWYANIPEETPWWFRRGASVASHPMNNLNSVSGFNGWALLVVFGHFIIPFAYLLSRHMKRNREALLIGAVWMLVMHWCDMFWMIMPELDNGKWFFGLPEIGAAVGMIGIFAALLTWKLSRGPLRPLGDPRLEESLAFHNI